VISHSYHDQSGFVCSLWGVYADVWCIDSVALRRTPSATHDKLTGGIDGDLCRQRLITCVCRPLMSFASSSFSSFFLVCSRLVLIPVAQFRHSAFSVITRDLIHVRINYI
jgi:hypothetical protein